MGFFRTLFGKVDVGADAIEILTAQHAELDMYFEQIEKRDGNRRTLFTELADRLAAHATIEEKIFYPAVMAASTDDMLHEAVEEHLAIKRLLADMITLRVDDEEFEAKLSVLKEQVTHHAHKEEEGKLFPKVRHLLGVDERAALGNEMLVMFEELMQSHPYKNIPSETDAAAELPRR